jgi:hypothetical protein
MAPDPARTGPARIERAIKAIKARINALDECDRELTIALLTGHDADVTTSPDASHAGLPAQLQQRTEPIQAASLHVRHLCLADQPVISVIPAVIMVSGT